MVSVMVLSIIFQGTYDPPIAYAWDNIGDYPQEEGVHPAINKAAYDTFVSQRMPTDQYLKNASLDGKPVWGDAWDRSDGTSPTDYIPQANRQKSVKDWLIEGGFSADEPEWDMALRHFYDPIREPHYLTDIIRDLPESAQKLVTKVTWANLTTDAYSWCFGRDNLFSFTNGKEYYRSALADTSNALGKNCGKAWRAVGESMHLISDMTVPAHVRNDAHMPIDIDKLGIRIALFDPLEYYTFTEHVARYGKSQGMSDLYDYHTAYESDQSIQDLFKEVATWTNENFFSRDTVLRYKQSTTSNGQLLYQKPMVVFEPDKSWYYTAFIAGNRDFPVAAPWSIKGILWMPDTPALYLDWYVLESQRSVLIPTAIKASSAVLDAFLPRFEVKIDSVQPDTQNKGMSTITAHIDQIPTREWPANRPLTIGNGAHVVVDSVDTTVTTQNNLDNNKNLNKIKVRVAATENSKIKVYYDLGGYKINSEESSSLSIPSQTLPTGYIQSHSGGKTYNYVAPVTLIAYGGAPKSTGYKWSVATGSTLPPGTTVDPDTGIFHGSGIPNDGMFQGAGVLRADTYVFRMQVSDGSKTSIGTFSFKVEDIPYYPPGSLFPNPVPVVVFQQPLGGTVRLPDARVGSGYGASLMARGDGVFPWAWYLWSGSIPAGMDISKTTGVIWGTPLASAAGKTYTFTVNVKDRNGNDAAPVGTTEPVTYTISVPP